MHLQLTQESIVFEIDTSTMSNSQWLYYFATELMKTSPWLTMPEAGHQAKKMQSNPEEAARAWSVALESKTKWPQGFSIRSATGCHHREESADEAVYSDADITHPSDSN